MPEETIFNKGRTSGKGRLELEMAKAMREEYELFRQPEKVYASDSAYCPRKAVKLFTKTGKTDTITARSKAYMKIGVAIHELIASGLDAAELLIYEEFRMPLRKKAPDIRGILDIIHFDTDGTIWGMEIKSCGAMPSRPKPEYIKQAQIYSATAGFPFRITYLSRNVAGRDQKLLMRSFEVDCSEEALLNTLTAVCSIGLFYKEGVQPPMPDGFTLNSCKWCPYKDECWEGNKSALPDAPIALIPSVLDEAREMAEKVYAKRNKLRDFILVEASKGSLVGQKRLKAEGW